MADPEGLASDFQACPLTLKMGGVSVPLPEAPQNAGLEPPLAAWRIASWHGEGTGPVVEVSHQDIPDPTGRIVPACVLKVTAVPQPPFDGIDWRLGYSVPLYNKVVERYGKLTFTADLLADRAAILNGGSVYLYDGAVPSVAGLADVKPRWDPVVIDTELSENAGYVEIWIRLVLQGEISNPVTITFANPTLSLHTARPGS